MVIAALVCLTGCWPQLQAPASVVAAAEKYADAVRALPGVVTVEAQVESVDPKDRPNEWRARVVVDARAAQDLEEVTALIAAVPPLYGAQLQLTVRFPAAAGLAPVDLTNPQQTDVTRAAVLRAMPFVERVSLSGTFSVQITAGTGLGDAVAAIRASRTLTSDRFDSLTIFIGAGGMLVGVSQAGPSDALVALIERLRGDDAVHSISAYEPQPERERPSLSVETDAPQQLADTLAALEEQRGDGRPRTAFRVRMGDDSIGGYVGLPLGSPEPDDLPVAESAPQPPDPEVIAALLAADTASVTELLDATVASSGIPGTPVVSSVGCTRSGSTSQARGTLTLPVFDYTNSAEPAYAAIVAGWQAAGFAQTEQATGTAIYTADATQRVEQLTIRGTASGIEITATGRCRG